MAVHLFCVLAHLTYLCLHLLFIVVSSSLVYLLRARLTEKQITRHRLAKYGHEKHQPLSRLFLYSPCVCSYVLLIRHSAAVHRKEVKAGANCTDGLSLDDSAIHK